MATVPDILWQHTLSADYGFRFWGCDTGLQLSPRSIMFICEENTVAALTAGGLSQINYMELLKQRRDREGAIAIGARRDSLKNQR